MEKKSDRVYLESTYGKFYKKALESERKGDIQLFINCYNLLMDAIAEYEAFEVNNILNKKAFHDMFLKECDYLRYLKNSIVERNML